MKKTYKVATVTVTETESAFPTECPKCGADITEGDTYFEFPAPIGELCEDCVMEFERTAMA